MGWNYLSIANLQRTSWEVWAWKGIFIAHIIMDVIYPCCKRGPWCTRNPAGGMPSLAVHQNIVCRIARLTKICLEFAWIVQLPLNKLLIVVSCYFADSYTQPAFCHHTAWLQCSCAVWAAYITSYDMCLPAWLQCSCAVWAAYITSYDMCLPAWLQCSCAVWTAYITSYDMCLPAWLQCPCAVWTVYITSYDMRLPAWL